MILNCKENIMQDCIFCKIISGQASAKKIYEDDQVIAILDHRPVREGHVIVVPKMHIDHFVDLDAELAAHICKVGNLIGKKIQAVLKPKRVGFAVAGFGIPHAHYHVIPMWEEHDITSAQYVARECGAVTFNMDHIPIADDQKQNELVELLKVKNNGLEEFSPSCGLFIF